MSTALAHPAKAPAFLRHVDSPERWQAALKRAKDAGVTVYELGVGRYAVTSTSNPGRAYEVTLVPERCTCPAAQLGDPVCVHRAAVRHHLHPDPETPAHAAYDPDEEALRWATADRDRAYRDMERYTRRIERGEVLTDGEFFAFECAQDRALAACTRIADLSAKLSQNAQVVA